MRGAASRAGAANLVVDFLSSPGPALPAAAHFRLKNALAPGSIRSDGSHLSLLSLLTVAILLYVPGHDDRRGDVQDPRTLDTAYRLVFRGQSRYGSTLRRHFPPRIPHETYNTVSNGVREWSRLCSEALCDDVRP